MPHKNSRKPLRVALAAGGTGGHIMPALALSEALGNIGHPVEIEFICGNRPIELKIYSDAGIKPRIFPVGAVTKGGIGKRTLQGAGMGVGFVKSMVGMRRYDIVVGMGGYITAPVLSAARVARVPIVLHDSNAILGKVNRMFAAKADAIACGMPLADIPERIDPAHIHEVGTPVRMSIAKGNRQEAAKEMYFNPDTFTLFVNGGSQGSRVINNLMAGTLGSLSAAWTRPHPLQVIWSTGPDHIQNVRQALKEQPNLKGQFWIAPTIERMDQAYAGADLVICRAGGSTIAEILLCGLPSILFPLPIASDDHQRYNAIILRRRQAAIVLEEEETEPRELAQQILSLANDPGRLQAMSKAAQRLACPGAARDLARLIIDTALGEKAG